MALSGSFYSNVGSHWRIQGEWSATQNISANTSTITLKTYWIALDSYGAISSSTTKDGSSTIYGTKDVFSGAGLASLSGGQKKLLNTQTKTITHDADGSMSGVGLAVSFNPEVTLSGTYYGTVGASTTVTLNTIPRASSISSSADFTAGSDFTTSISRASSDFTHTVKIYVNGTLIKTFTKVATSVNSSFTATEKEKIFQILNGGSTQDTKVEVTTYDGSTQIGSTVSKTGTVTAPQATTISSGTVRTVYTDQASIPLGITRYDSEFTHTLKIYIGGNDPATATLVTTLANVGASVTWTPTQAERDILNNAMKNVNTMDGNIQVFTYYGSTLVRSATNNDIDFNIRNSNPVFSSSTIAYTDNTPAISAVTGDGTKIVQNMSSIKVTLPVASKAVGQNGATMVNYIATLAGQQVTASYSSTADVLFYFTPIDAKVDQTLTIKAVDSRGNSTTLTRTITMIPYSLPTVNGTAKRKNGFDNATTLLATGSLSPLTIGGVNKNTVQRVEYRYKKTSEPTSVVTWATWLGFTASTSGSTFTTTAVTLDLDNTYTYNVEFKVTDKLGAKTYATTVSQGKPIFFIDSLKKTLGVGKFSTSYMLDVAGDVNVDGAISVLKGITANTLKLSSSVDASGTSTTHALTIGDDTVGSSMKMDGNELSSFKDGATDTIHLNPDGGGIAINNNMGVGARLLITGGYILQDAKIVPSLATGWTNYSASWQPLTYYMDKQGFVHIEGMIAGGTKGTTIFTLPAGYRPAKNEIFAVANNDSTNWQYARIYIYSDGRVVWSDGGASAWLSLSGIKFRP